MEHREQLTTPSDHRRMPWRNGGGFTTELLRHPASAEGRFLWRLSIAEIDRLTPFSRFLACERWIAVIDGAGIVLKAGRAPTVTLTQRSGFFRFSGDGETDCRPVDGPCRTLNLIVDHRHVEARARLVSLAGDQPIDMAFASAVIVHPMDADAAVDTGYGPTSVPVGHSLTIYAPGAGLINGSGRCLVVGLAPRMDAHRAWRGEFTAA